MPTTRASIPRSKSSKTRKRERAQDKLVYQHRNRIKRTRRGRDEYGDKEWFFQRWIRKLEEFAAATLLTCALILVAGVMTLEVFSPLVRLIGNDE